MKEKKPPGKLRSFFLYFNAVLLLLLLGGGTYYALSLYTRGQTCFTVEQVQQDSRCLYIYYNMVFEKGTRAEPHQNNPCGTDVSAILPQSHILDKAARLDPNYKGNICENTPIASPTPEPSPTAAPTAEPTSTIPPAQPSPTSPPSAAANTPTVTTTQTTQATSSATPTTSYIGGADISSPTPTISDSVLSETPSPEPTALTTLPVTGKLEWIAVALIPVGLLMLGLVF